MPSAVQVVDPQGGIVFNTMPYSKVFFTTAAQSPAGAYLVLTVKTGYSDPSERATVVLNNTQIGTIDPRQWINHFVVDLETIILPFDNDLLSPGFSIFPSFVIPGPNVLQIVPTGTTPDNYVLVGCAICHFQSQQ